MHVRARYYEVETGRFVQKDQRSGNINRPQSLHPYVYCENNPVNCVDPDGNVSHPVKWIVWVGVVTIIAGVVSGIIADELSEFFNLPGADHLVIGEIAFIGALFAPPPVKIFVILWFIVAEMTIAITDAFEARWGDVDLIIPSPGISY